MPAILLLKLFLVPSMIYAVTLSGRRWGPAVAGWLSAFPIVAGPILLMITVEQGAGFAARAAQGTLLAVLAILVFTFAYAWASLRFQAAGSMLAALLAYGLAVAGLQAVSLSVELCFVVVLLALLVSPRLFPAAVLVAAGAESEAKKTKPRAASGMFGGDLPWRMLAGAVLVLAVSYSAASIGPRLSGFLAMFPIMGTVLVGFSRVRSGREFTVALLRGMVYGYFAFAPFCLVLSLQLREDAISFAFGAAFACALAVQLVVKRLMGRSARPA